MKMQRFWVGRALLLAVAVLYAGGYVRAQEAKDTLTLTLDRALEIALSDNPTIKVAEEEIALKKVTHKETWQNLLPQASIDGTWNHTISAAQTNMHAAVSRHKAPLSFSQQEPGRTVVQDGYGQFEYGKRGAEYQFAHIRP